MLHLCVCVVGALWVPRSSRHLFDGKGAIKRYDSAFEVIDEHFPVRLDLYSKRRDRQLVDLANRCVMLFVCQACVCMQHACVRKKTYVV
jgi:hypothetical protein